MAFLPELIVLAGALGLFVVALGNGRVRQAQLISLVTAGAAIVACAVSLGAEQILFDGAYQVDLFSQLMKLAFAGGFLLILLTNGDLPDIPSDIRPEYHLFLTLSVSGLMLLVSCVDLIALVVSLELSAFPLYFLVAMRREREGQRVQMESAIKYMMFGVAANGLMLFGMSYLFGLTGSTLLPAMMAKLPPLAESPVAVAGLAMMFCGVFYKLAIFPFHFWTPDVYEGAANETASLIASLPKVGAVAVLLRFAILAPADSHAMTVLLTTAAAASMLYGNLVALWQRDLKRLLGFSGIAHAGYALIGFVAHDRDGYTAAVYYILGYVLMVLACFAVIARVSRDGTNLPLDDLGGLHRRSPLLAVTLLVGVFALAGIPPFVGFTGKLALLRSAWVAGHHFLVIFAVINTVFAMYYYLSIVRETCLRDAGEVAPIRLTATTKSLCVILIGGVVLLGVLPGRLLDGLSSALTFVRAAPIAGQMIR